MKMNMQRLMAINLNKIFVLLLLLGFLGLIVSGNPIHDPKCKFMKMMGRKGPDSAAI